MHISVLPIIFNVALSALAVDQMEVAQRLEVGAHRLSAANGCGRGFPATEFEVALLVDVFKQGHRHTHIFVVPNSCGYGCHSASFCQTLRVNLSVPITCHETLWTQNCAATWICSLKLYIQSCNL